MKIPSTGRKKALIVIDLQSAFIKSHNRHIVPRVSSLIKQVAYDAYVEAAWHSGSPLWAEMMKVDHPRDANTHTVDEVLTLLRPLSPLQVVKSSRSVFLGDQDVAGFLRAKGVEDIHLVGTETNDCVMASAISAFDLGFRPFVIEECCESGYEGRHIEGVRLLSYQKMTNNSCLAPTINVDI